VSLTSPGRGRTRAAPSAGGFRPWKAAVVTAYDAPPRYLDFPDPVARGKDEVVADVLAAGLHPRVRSQANGSHYTSTGTLPLVPGVDAVVRDPEGRIRYAVLDDTTLGTMAERTVIERPGATRLAWAS
jgi:hypothetical protein